jgi:hypothetical protein
MTYRKLAGELEGRAALLSSKNAALEEELKSYQEYMKTTVMQYKKKIQALKNPNKKHSIDSTSTDNNKTERDAGNVSNDLEDPTGVGGTKFPVI